VIGKSQIELQSQISISDLEVQRFVNLKSEDLNLCMG